MSQLLELGHLVDEFVEVGDVRDVGETDLGEEWVVLGAGVGGGGWLRGEGGSSCGGHC